MSGPPSRELTRQERAAIRRLVTDLCANYDSQDKLCRSLDCPCYMLHKWWTGSFCRYFREAVLPTDPALESAITGEDTSLKQKTCPVCGRAYLPTTSLKKNTLRGKLKKSRTAAAPTHKPLSRKRSRNDESRA